MDASGLSALSPELRNLIYEFLFTSNYAVTLACGKIMHPLTRTCRQIRHETLSMYLSLTPFNSHLDDRPATPLAHWLRGIGPDLCVLLREVNIWDLHMLNGVLHGLQSTQEKLKQGAENGEPFVLRPVGREVFHSSWYLKDIIVALQSIGIGLERFCTLQASGGLKQTSHFAIVKLAETQSAGNAMCYVEEFGLSVGEQESLIKQLREGRREVRFLDGIH